MTDQETRLRRASWAVAQYGIHDIRWATWLKFVDAVAASGPTREKRPFPTNATPAVSIKR